MKKLSLVWKLSLAFVFVAVTTALLVYLYMSYASRERLNRLIIDQQRRSIESEFADYYQNNASWDGIQDFILTKFPGPPPEPMAENGNVSNVARDRHNFFILVDTNNQVIIPFEPDFPVGATVSAEMLGKGTPVTVDGQTVGTIITRDRPLPFYPEESLFLQRTNNALLTGGLAAVCIAVIIGMMLARSLTRPLKALTAATQTFAKGQNEQQVAVNSEDEIGQLVTAFNSMSREVDEVNRLRRQMTADIAHDLRTPLMVIGGYIESMRDGVLAPTPERLDVIYQEIERLENLVIDLRTLSQADAGELPVHPQAISPRNILERAIAPYRQRADQQDVRLELNAEANLPSIFVDEARMIQVLCNLLSNSMRYTPSGGKISLNASQEDGSIVLSVDDTGSGISAEDLPLVFNRFYRADKSRHTETGESGLGLAIAKALVEAQGGSIDAQSTLGKGTSLRIHLPAHPTAADSVQDKNPADASLA